MKMILPLLLLMALASCDDGEGPSPDASHDGAPDALSDGDMDVESFGSLTLTITAPEGVTPEVIITGPAGFSRSLSASETLTELVPGDYLVTVNDARLERAIVDEVYAGEGGSATVTGEETATFQVIYERRPGSGLLWVPVFGAQQIKGFSTSQLEVGGSDVSPSIALGLGSSTHPYSAAFDQSGNLWIGTQAGTILGFTAQQLAASGTPSPQVIIESGSSDINGLAFDPTGRLWTSTHESLRQFTPDQLRSSGAPEAAVIITGADTVPLTTPSEIAFDAEGSLWVAVTNANSIYAYSADQLETGGSLTPTIILSDNGGSLVVPRGLAFDAAGALWVANWQNSRLVKFNPDQIESSGSPTPFVVLNGLGVNLLHVAFDNENNLWVNATFDPSWSSSGSIVRALAADLVSSGSVTPITIFTSVGGFDSGGILAFNPPPTALPLGR